MREIKRKARTFVPGEKLTSVDTSNKANPSGLNPEQIKTIKAKIARATTLEEIESLNHMLRTGQVPGGAGSEGKTKNGSAGSQPYDPMVEEEDDD